MPRSRALIPCVVVVLVGVSSGFPGTGARDVSLVTVSPVAAQAWSWPVEPPHRVVNSYRGPQTPYSAGHRGIDVVSAAGDPVLAVHDGVVAFAGVVVSRPVLTLAHDEDLLSSVEPVTALVSPGDRVVTGQTIGIVAVGGHCTDCLHLGVRHKGDYVSPLLFLGGATRAVLLPLPG